MEKYRAIIAVHILFGINSLAGVFAKLAAGEVFFSSRFCLYYGGVLFIFAGYAIGWQQIIKKLPLSFAYANKAVVVLWGSIWGWLCFGEQLSLQRISGVFFVMAGIVIYSFAESRGRE